MIEQVAIGYRIEAAIAEHALHVLAQFLALGERLVKLSHDRLFFGSKFEGMLGIHGREIGVEQFIFLALDFNHTLLEVHFVEQQTVLHVKVGTSLDGSSFEFELDNANSFMHLSNELCGAGSLRILCATVLRQEALTGIVGISIHSECS